MTTARLLALDLAVLLLTAALWGAAAAAVLGTARRRTAAALVGAAVLATAGRVAVVAALADAGWWFVREKVLVALPLVVVPGLVAAGLVLSALRRHRAPGPGARAAVAAAAGGGVAGMLATFVTGYAVGVAQVVLLAAPVLVPPAWLLTRGPGRVVAVGTAVLLLGAAVGGAWWGSLLPGRIGHDHPDPGGGPAVSVADLRGPAPAPGEAVHHFTLTARHADVALPDGRTVAAWTFDGRVPGPALVVTQGELVEVELRNADIAEGVTLHWHGYPVPNGEDGVAGVTQDAVAPGGSFTYRFRADRPGTYWYHSHQLSHVAVRRGLYGTLVVLPAAPVTGADLTVPIHTLDGTLLAAPVDGPDRLPSAPGAPVRLRLVDTDDGPHVLTVRGSPFRIAAVDGGDLADPAPTTGRLSIPAGGRYDLVFTLPDGPVALDVDGRTAVRWGDGEPPPDGAQPLIDITRYPTPAPSPLGPAPRFDVEQTLVLDRTLGFLDGVPAQLYPVDGLVWPDIPPTVVHEGDLVRFTVVNRGSEPHPMHPHGHPVLVLSRDGVPASGPLWTDSFEVGPGEVWEVALVADNPGIWADHCHNLDHAAAGMVLHLVYGGVTDPYAVGPDTGNIPE